MFLLQPWDDVKSMWNKIVPKKALLTAIIISILFWTGETLIEVRVFRVAADNFIQHLFFPGFHALWMRSISMVAIVLLVFYIYKSYEHKKLENIFKEAAIKDDLTGLYNRRGFFTLADHQLKMASRNRKNMALLYTDLDGMKTINDDLGHEAGDQALVDVAMILNKTFRESDIIARIGGDEFVVLLPELPHPAKVRIIVNHLEDSLKAHNKNANRRYKLFLSIGIAHYDPEYPCSLSKLLNTADKLMYKDKKSHNQAK